MNRDLEAAAALDQRAKASAIAEAEVDRQAATQALHEVRQNTSGQ
jgi:hypothetical protein